VSTSSALRRFFSTPKGLLLILLAILAALAAPHEGILLVAQGLTAAIVTAALIDAVILRKKKGSWVFPDGAVLSGLFVAMVLSPYQPWYVFAAGGAIAVLSKYVFRTRFANVFNPAAFGLVACYYLFGALQNWWGALPELPPAALLALFATGVFITDRVNKMPLALVFLGLYYILFTATAFAGNAEHVAEIFRSPDLQAVLFFAFFILTDPPTSPTKYRDQIVCGIIVAISSYFFFEVVGAVYYLLAGVLVGNVWEAWRRRRV
jgi:Na+-translocating ferredoxin:NAD+ oxidoreductase RnfD subunit